MNRPPASFRLLAFMTEGGRFELPWDRKAPNGFQDRRVMTASLTLHMYTTYVYVTRMSYDYTTIFHLAIS